MSILSRLSIAISLFPAIGAAADLPALSKFGLGNYEFGTSWASSTASFETQSNGANSASLRYFFRIDGPSAVVVPIDVEYYIFGTVSQSWVGLPTTADLTAFTSSGSQISVQTLGNARLAKAEATFKITGKTSTHTGAAGNGTFHLSLQSNQIYSVLLTAVASVSAAPGVSNSFNSFSHAYADPFISIGTTFHENNPDYSLSFSTGISNVVAVPEPSSFALMLGGIAFGLWRRRIAA